MDFPSVPEPFKSRRNQLSDHRPETQPKVQVSLFPSYSLQTFKDKGITTNMTQGQKHLQGSSCIITNTGLHENGQLPAILLLSPRQNLSSPPTLLSPSSFLPRPSPKDRREPRKAPNPRTVSLTRYRRLHAASEYSHRPARGQPTRAANRLAACPEGFKLRRLTSGLV